MKKYILRNIAIGLISFIGLTSCDDFLETKPGNASPTEDAIENEEDLLVAIRGMYSALLSADYYGNTFVMMGDIQGDDVQTSNVGKRTEQLYRFSYRQATVPVGLWEIPYKAINRANVILSAIENNGFIMTNAIKDYKGQALATRALCHFNILITYGYPYLKDQGASWGASLVREPLKASSLPARSTVAEGYKMVIEDLEEALKVIGTEVNNGKFNSWSVEALLARVHLYKGDWDKAFEYADHVASQSPYELISNKDYLKAWEEEYTSESLFDLHISDLSSGNRELFGYVIHPKGYSAVVATKEFEDLLNEDTLDIRTQLLKPVDTIPTSKFYVAKAPGRGGQPAVNNVRVLRLSDIYLIAAEAALKKSKPNQAKADFYLNEIIQRANPTATDVVATEDLILTERRKELVLEGHRFFDMMRLGKTYSRKGGYHILNDIDLVSPDWNDFRIVKAIPQGEIDVNPNIRKQQNPGY
ncbi:RagB/SusD family nutrient uptake outer membrane protein [Porphyromonadaceae bacterium OttesenSCG-928-L07]|nr:RagB/SusD family nutrient uptake outer membrane protein [Porphyromonadaceae bacterium OttesenSCG-928-L07]MDL2252258.1 RagB/SusD family nutrient uptake outer membrane protein [Odoribacter sp. OttesenSCG-928-J03]MDL2330813.1 RagB/SusD family nutrient uptake outer membrane protein [Odoribacter sp. OttesenSCG-928-A06]